MAPSTPMLQAAVLTKIGGWVRLSISEKISLTSGVALEGMLTRGKENQSFLNSCVQLCCSIA